VNCSGSATDWALSLSLVPGVPAGPLKWTKLKQAHRRRWGMGVSLPPCELDE